MRKILSLVLIILFTAHTIAQTSSMFRVQCVDKYGDKIAGEFNEGCKLTNKNLYNKTRSLSFIIDEDYIYVASSFDDDDYSIDIKDFDYYFYDNSGVSNYVTIAEFYLFLQHTQTPIKMIENRSDKIIYTMSVSNAQQLAALIKRKCPKAMKYVSAKNKYNEKLATLKKTYTIKTKDNSRFVNKHCIIQQNGKIIFDSIYTSSAYVELDFNDYCLISYDSVFYFYDENAVNKIQQSIDSLELQKALLMKSINKDYTPSYEKQIKTTLLTYIDTLNTINALVEKTKSSSKKYQKLEEQRQKIQIIYENNEKLLNDIQQSLNNEKQIEEIKTQIENLNIAKQNAKKMKKKTIKSTIKLNPYELLLVFPIDAIISFYPSN